MEKVTFLIVNKFRDIPENTVNKVILSWDNWNDFSYYTLFGITYVNFEGKEIDLGAVKIAYFGQTTGGDAKILRVGDEFERLEENYFSLGTEDTYYDNLNNLNDDIKDQILLGLRDIAFNIDLYDKAINEDVTLISLLRDISRNTVVNQFRRIANGGARLTNYNFSYFFPKNEIEITPPKIDFNIVAESNPPSNIQIIIGSNGVGKSHLLNGMIDSIIEHNNTEVSGRFQFNDDIENETFSNLICVTFSAFDEFQFKDKYTSSETKYQYIGLKNLEQIDESNKGQNNNLTFADEFTSSIGLIISSSKINRWKSAIKQLESDPIFKDENFIDLIENYNSEDLKPIQSKFAKLSSGHKIILLTITRLVELLQEKSLVFFDEPETHLHPPLLSSFIRSISELLMNRNAVCIMTTHSPIVLQEVPNSCVYKLSRKGGVAKFERLKIETFGENIGILTNDIFGLEVTESGFYKILKELVVEKRTYETALASLNSELGIEGKSILRSLFFDKIHLNDTN